MATPTGQIAFSQLNNEILQATGTTQLNMNTAGVRLGFGSTSQLSISELKKAWGATITCGTYSSKFGDSYGYDVGLTIGSMDSTTYTPGYGIDAIKTSSGINYSAFGAPIAPGFELNTALNRWAIGGGVRGPLSGYPATANEYWFDGPSMPGSGTVTFGARWS